MKISRIELRKIYLPYLSPFRSGNNVEAGNTSIIVKAESGNFSGWGEAPVTNSLWYNIETVSTAWAVMEENLVPLILKNELTSPEDIFKLFSNIKGNNIAKAGLEFAVWDLFGRIEGTSLSKMLGGTMQYIPVGVSIGIKENIDELLKAVNAYIQSGYKRIKIKIKPGWDIEPIKRIRELYPDLMLQADGNSTYSINDIPHLKNLDKYNLLLIEQPLGFDDIYDHSLLQKEINTPVCLDESIISFELAKLAIKLKACRILNIKPSRVGGLTAAKQIHDYAYKEGIPVWCGGMLETGIGRAINVSLASLTGFSLPGDISANDRYFKRDIVKNPFSLNMDGTITVPELPGHGALIDEEFLEEITLEHKVIAH